MPRIALTRPISASFARCELTYLERVPIDLDRARRQHAAYEAVLESLGWTIVRLPPLDEQPDAVFVEDAAIALDELAVVAPMGASSRAGESRSVEEALARYLPVARLTPPATLDGGDVMRAGRRVFVGRSRRTNAAAIDQLRTTARALRVRSDFRGRERRAPPQVRLLDRRRPDAAREHDWVDLSPFAGLKVLPVDASEAWGASVLHADGHVVMPTGFPRPRGCSATRGSTVHEVDLTEIRKAEGGPTCLSILLPDACLVTAEALIRSALVFCRSEGLESTHRIEVSMHRILSYRSLLIATAIALAPLAVNAQATAAATCKDGTTSTATGRGACSGHGGVDKSAKSAKASHEGGEGRHQSRRQGGRQSERAGAKEPKATREGGDQGCVIGRETVGQGRERDGARTPMRRTRRRSARTARTRTPRPIAAPARGTVAWRSGSSPDSLGVPGKN